MEDRSMSIKSMVVFMLLAGLVLLSCSSVSNRPAKHGANSDQTSGQQLTNHPPVLRGITARAVPWQRPLEVFDDIALEQIVYLIPHASDPDRDELHYDWSVTGGHLDGATDRVVNDKDRIVKWIAPSTPGTVQILVKVTDGNITVKDSISIEVKKVGPRMSIWEKHTSFDFGFVPPNLALSHRFRVVSTGDDSLIIKGVDAGCNCRLTVQAAPYPSKWKVEWQLVVDLESESQPGSYTRDISVLTNEIEGVRKLELNYEVAPLDKTTYPIRIEPWGLDLSEQTGLRFIIRNVSNSGLGYFVKIYDSRVLVGPAHASNGPLVIRIPAFYVGPDSTTEMLAALNSEYIDSSFAGFFTLEFHGTDTTSITVPVWRKISGRD